MAEIYIGTSGWHYNHWRRIFYPASITGYNELKYHAKHFNTVENNSSFYRIASESAYHTWDRMTPTGYKFSLKLNKTITHIHRLELTDETKSSMRYILDTTQTLGPKLGAILIQLPPSLKYDLKKLATFLGFFVPLVRSHPHPLDIAIEFRNQYWLNPEVYGLLRRHNVALAAAQSSRYPEVRELTASIAYIRLHGPKKLFASSYSTKQLEEWAHYIRAISPKTERIYVYFNNDFFGYAVRNAKKLSRLLDLQPLKENHE